MSHLTNKSEINRAAADLLQKNSYYPTVVHSAYYSCVQLMKHVMIHCFGKSESTIDSERRTQQLGIHEFLINQINSELRKDNKDWKSFNVNIMQLKKLRGEADYAEVLIDSSKGNTAIQLSDTVLKNIKTNFKI